MPAQVTNYKCPACTGPLHFEGATGKLECEYCGSKFEVAEIEALYAEKDRQAAEAAHAEQRTAGEENPWDYSSLGSDWGEDGAKMKAYSCPSCGAELICDETTAATSCPYCGNPTIVPGQFSGSLKPDFVIPFKLDKEAAKTALKNHYKGKKLLPGAFARENHIEEVKGVYVPFWLFDGAADVDVRFEATRSRVHTTDKERITDTDHFMVHRAGTVTFEKIPVDAATKMPDEHMDSIEPFDYSELKPFSTAYLPGYLADKYDVTAEESARRADLRAENTAVEAMAATAKGYETCIPVEKHIILHRGKVRYALLPVWMLNTKWNGKEYLFAMNGQTGKLVGDLPVSWGKFWAWFAGIAVPLTAAITAVLHFLN